MFQAFKLNMTGNGYVWMLLGFYPDKWWEVDYGPVDCTAEEITEAVVGSKYIGIRTQGLSSTDEPIIGNIVGVILSV